MPIHGLAVYSPVTNHVTCLDGLNGPAQSIRPIIKDLISSARTSLAMVVAIAITPLEEAEVMQPLNGKFPNWVSSKDRKLLEASIKDIKANVVVATAGSGNYKTVKEAVASVPKNSNTLDDGMDSTIITGSLNIVDGTATFNSATLAAVGDGFIAQDIWFQNRAGPLKQQAVALRVGADQSVINRCRIDAYQDTLYTHSNRQFYRDCYITGTVDFIFGNAAVVFQN
ncbi:hypothetical protein F0562_018914 [Nyssa sinensis]|uniref:Pectinesterase n=1 Tax=Nyssa sinensis TaxID=561372 RepID=A0A5J4ZA69_9ASTE|nr:hypothetical protein F0562_018914 [Nyssa sinensis]